mmetsp:Transcript_31524/g.81555  ORF Transcript_31524/g.81555 Transcript_31524/m.81555 type:complete len:219 (-) Transcript_31524:1198-1854(-)
MLVERISLKKNATSGCVATCVIHPLISQSRLSRSTVMGTTVLMDTTSASTCVSLYADRPTTCSGRPSPQPAGSRVAVYKCASSLMRLISSSCDISCASRSCSSSVSSRNLLPRTIELHVATPASTSSASSPQSPVITRTLMPRSRQSLTVSSRSRSPREMPGSCTIVMVGFCRENSAMLSRTVFRMFSQQMRTMSEPEGATSAVFSRRSPETQISASA